MGFILNSASIDSGFESTIGIGAQFEKNLFSQTDFEEHSIKFSEELKHSVNKRRAEFLAGRYVAGEALKQFNCHTSHVGRGKHNEPIWPDGFTGSITHSHNYAIAIVGRTDTYFGLGVDIEPTISDIDFNVISQQIVNRNELALLSKSGLSKYQLLTIIFATKEAYFKAAFKSVNRYIEFNAISIQSIDVCAGSSVVFKTNASMADKIKKDSLFKANYHLHDNGQISVFVALRA